MPWEALVNSKATRKKNLFDIINWIVGWEPHVLKPW